MRLKTIGTIVAAAGLVAATAITTPTPAEARNGRIAAGVAAGLLGGALLGGALASRPYYGPGYYVAPAPVYVEPACYTARERYWDGYRWRSRRVRVCD